MKYLSQNEDGMSSRELSDIHSYLKNLMDHLNENIRSDKVDPHER